MAGIAAWSARARCLPTRNRNVFQFFRCIAVRPPNVPAALARSQAARRRRVLDATLELAADGGFDAVQMRDVAAAADVALGTVYRYFSSKERLLLEAMAEQQADLRAYLDAHPPRERDAGRAGASRCSRRSNRSLRRYPDVDRGDGARVRLGAAARTPTSCGGSPRS